MVKGKWSMGHEVLAKYLYRQLVRRSFSEDGRWIPPKDEQARLRRRNLAVFREDFPDLSTEH